MRIWAFVGLNVALACAGLVYKNDPATLPQNFEPYKPRIRPDDFGLNYTNEYFPLAFGNQWNYSASDGGMVVVTVTEDVTTIMGIPCFTVTDVLTVNGTVAESTVDYYAVDRRTNVMYMGEKTVEYLPNGTASAAGSWIAGEGGAEPGFIMLAQPFDGVSYRQP